MWAFKSLVGEIRIIIEDNASDSALIIAYIVRERLEKRKQNYFVSDSAPVNKAAVHEFIGHDGNRS